ncbi:unnamed protein product [Porites evermanni]|uniref:Uncharacterized protein n=1 Tax=Porites evermanni TaxID=104178 RepID=A0ABN8LVN2_9CNID|nr:unnamed protein product [Porites evermanni]
MQLAVIEFSRNVLGWKGANTTENEPDTTYPVALDKAVWRKKLIFER